MGISTPPSSQCLTIWFIIQLITQPSFNSWMFGKIRYIYIWVWYLYFYFVHDISLDKNLGIISKSKQIFLVVSTFLKNMSQNWESFPNRGENKKYLEPPPRYVWQIYDYNSFFYLPLSALSCISSVSWSCPRWISLTRYTQVYNISYIYIHGPYPDTQMYDLCLTWMVFISMVKVGKYTIHLGNLF